MVVVPFLSLSSWSNSCLHLVEVHSRPRHANHVSAEYRPCKHNQRKARLHNALPQRRSGCIASAAQAEAVNAELHSPARLAVFVSGGGSNFRAIHKVILDGRMQAEVAVVVSNNPTCGGAEYAASQDIPVLVYPASKKFADGLSTEGLMASLQRHGVQYIILAGYLKLLPPELVKAFPKKTLNIHPGLLPSFGGPGMYGQRVHEAVIYSGARFSGPTVHFVDEEYDSGAILAQRVVPVFPDDTPQTLAARVLQQEHELYPVAVAALVEGRVGWRDDGVPFMWFKN